MPDENGNRQTQDGDDSGDQDQDLEEQDENEDENSDQDGQDENDEGEDLNSLSEEDKDKMIAKLRKENARRRVAARDARKAQRQQEEDARKNQDAAERAEAEKKRADTLQSRLQEVTVRDALRDYLADKYPHFIKLAPKIARFVDLTDVDVDDAEEVREAVESAAEDFVKDLPKPRDDDDNDRDRRPVGGLTRTPGRGKSVDDKQSSQRKAEFPAVYSDKPI